VGSPSMSGEGSVFTIIRRQWSGKSTLLRCLNYLEQPTSGEIYLDGKPIGFRDRGRRSGVPDTAANISAMRAEMAWSFSSLISGHT